MAASLVLKCTWPWLVSALQSMCACTAGTAAMIMCRHDIMNANYWSVNFYSWFAFPYFYYDVWAMYAAYRLRTPQLEAMSHAQAFTLFVKQHKLMMAHHILFPIFYFPIIVHYRGGKGDFFVGCLLNCELAIPCISLRAILLQLGKERSLAYMINGILMIVTFAMCRVLIFPILYAVYGLHAGIPFTQVPYHIPAICNIGSVILGSIQVYWLYGMIMVAVKFYRRRNASVQFTEPARNLQD